MNNFKIKSLDQWNEIGEGELIEFPAPQSSRTVEMEFNVTGKTAVYATTEGKGAESVLLAASEGMFAVQVSTRKKLQVYVQMDEGERVFLKTNTPDQRVEKMSDVKFTGIEKRKVRNPEMERILWQMNQNEQRRQLQLDDELTKLRAERADVKAQEKVIDDDVTEPISEPVDAADKGSGAKKALTPKDPPSGDQDPE